MTNRIARIAAVSVMALSFALPASAVTVAELQAQINALMAQLSAMQGGATVASSFTTDLTLGSKGDQVTALQQALVAKGFLTMPAGVAYGYFGNLTKSAVAAWQAANGITPAAGYFGPKSRAAFGGAVAGTPGTPATPAATGITTPGAEGTITASAATVSNATVYSGDTMAPVLAFKVKASNSDVAIQRLKIDLGTNNKIYTRAFATIYLVDEAGKTLASSPLNADTVTKDSATPARYTVTLTGFSSVVPKDATKTFTIKTDVQSFGNDADVKDQSWVFTLQNNAIRGVDGAGIDQYEGTNGLTKTITTGASLADTASLSLSTGANTPLTQEVVAAGGASNNEADKVSLLTFDIQAKKDNVLVTDLVATVTRTNGAATASSTFLYAGDTLIGTATLTGSTATFSDINYSISKDTTKTFTIKADVRSASAVQTTLAASVANSGITAENAAGDSITGSYLTGSATGNSIYVTNVGPVFTLAPLAAPVKGATASQNNYSTSTIAQTFNVTVKAVGGAIMFGSNASATPMFSNTAGLARSFVAYVGGAAVTGADLINASSTSYDVPSSGVSTAGLTASFSLAQDQTVTIPVTFTMQGNRTTGVGLTYGTYSIALERINWVGPSGLTASTFMAGQTAWRGSGVQLP